MSDASIRVFDPETQNFYKLKIKDAGDGTYGLYATALGAGLSQSLTRTYTASADMTTAADITAAPAAGQKIVVTDVILSADRALNFAIQMETSANVLANFYLGEEPVHIAPVGYLKADAADKKLQGKASIPGNVSVTLVYFSEA